MHSSKSKKKHHYLQNFIQTTSACVLPRILLHRETIVTSKSSDSSILPLQNKPNTYIWHSHSTSCSHSCSHLPVGTPGVNNPSGTSWDGDSESSPTASIIKVLAAALKSLVSVTMMVAVIVRVGMIFLFERQRYN